MGRVGMEMAPTSTMSSAETVAKIGRRMKKSTNKECSILCGRTIRETAAG